jgi:hypothetical protein
MMIKGKVWIVFLAVMFITLSCASGFADTNVGDYTLGGYISLGGGWLSDQPRHMNRGYLKEYLPFPEGFLAYTDLTLKSKDGLEYYKFWMSQPGLRDEDFLLQVGKLGVYHAEIEYDQLQHLYCTVNPFNSEIGILLERLRFSGYYLPTPDIAIFAENQFLRRTGWQPGSYVTSPTNPYNFTTYLRPIAYSQNDLKIGMEYDQPKNDQRSVLFQGRVAYHLSSFENGQSDLLARQPPVGSLAFVSLPPSNMANYITAEGAMSLLTYKTRIAGSFSYGWLSQNDFVSNTAGTFNGTAGLSASTVTGDISGVSRPIAPLTLRYSYRVYNFENNNLGNQILRTAFGTDQSLLLKEQYSYLRQCVNLGGDYRVNNKLAFSLGYAWQGVDRTNGQGRTSSNSPQVGVRLSPNNWLSLSANYAFTSRAGDNFILQDPLIYKFYAGNLIRNNANFIAEVYPANNVTCSFNFSIYNDNFTGSSFGLQNDRGWSTGVDVSWRPHDRVALSLGYDHQQLLTKELASQATGGGGVGALVTGDAGPTLTTSDRYDTFVARADIKLIPKKLNLTSRASFSFANSNYHNSFMPNLNEYYADIRTFLTYMFNERWACRAGYVFEAFGMSNSYQTLNLTGVTLGGAAGSNQQFNTLDGYYSNATAHLVQAFLQYKF